MPWRRAPNCAIAPPLRGRSSRSAPPVHRTRAPSLESIRRSGPGVGPVVAEDGLREGAGVVLTETGRESRYPSRRGADGGILRRRGGAVDDGAAPRRAPGRAEAPARLPRPPSAAFERLAALLARRRRRRRAFRRRAVRARRAGRRRRAGALRARSRMGAG